MILRRSYVRTLMASAALVAAVALAGCETDTLHSGKPLKELSPQMIAELQAKNMPKESQVLVRLFKQEAELEVWKQDASGRYELLKTYPICRWSGELGPKIKEGDRQAPEGFYNITPAQMNPNSQFYLSFNMGYPNAFDKAWGRTGAQLMVHGDCSSRGCYAMTDDQIGEIYALARESFFGGQRSFQVQAYPFRMTPANLAKHRNNPNMPFWKMLKDGNDHFEVSRTEPKVDVCEKHYVFNADSAVNASPADGIRLGTPWGGLQPQQTQAALKFNPVGKCPAYQVPQEIATEVAAKKQRDEAQVAELVRRGTPVAPVRTHADGGMHPTFFAKLQAKEVREVDGTVRYVVDPVAAKSLGSYVNPPTPTAEPEYPTGTVAATARAPAPKPAPAAVPAYALASADQRNVPPPNPAPTRTASGNVFSSLFTDNGPKKNEPPSEGPVSRVTSSVGRFLGLASEDKKPVPIAAPAAPKPAARPVTTAAAHPKPKQPDPAPAQAEAPRPTTAANASLLNGAQPTVPAGSFDSRWGALR